MLRLEEPAADLSVAMSLVSALRDIPLDDDLIVFGEIGLSGEIRSVSRAASRISEAQRLGFKRCIIPRSCMKNIPDNIDMDVIGVKTLGEAISIIR